MLLKLSRSTNSAATGVLAASRAREHLLDAIQDQRPVRQAGQRVVGRQERKLLLASRELFIRAPALGLKALAHPHEAELEAQLQDVQGLRRAPRGETSSSHGALAQHLGHRRRASTSSAWSPRAATPRDAPPARRRSARFPDRPHGPPRGPPRRSNGPPRAWSSALMRSKLSWTSASTSWPDPEVRATVMLEHVRGSRLQRLAEITKILSGLLDYSRRRRWDTDLIRRQVQAFSTPS